MRRALLSLLLASLVLAPRAAAQGENPWLADRVMNFAHQGGEDEFPSNTMYAFQSALDLGADWLEIDVNLTKDDHLVVMHDTTLDRTTNGTGPVRDRTLAEIQQLDAAYWHVPDVGARRVAERRSSDAYPLRGVRTKATRPPAGAAPDDFRVPELAEVLGRFSGVTTNIEIKGETEEIQMRTAEVLAQYFRLGETSGASGPFYERRDVIVVSFNQNVVDRFHQLAPTVPLAPGVGGGARFLLQNHSPGEGVVAFQIPITFRFGDQKLVVATPANVGRAHEAGYAVHVWLSNDTEDVPTYRRLLRMCVDAIMAARPSLLERELRRLDGRDPCGTRVADRSPEARRGAVRLKLRRAGQSPERRRGSVALHGIARSGRAGPRMGRGTWTLGSGRSRTVSRVRLNRLGRRAVRGRARFVMRAIVRERGRSVSARSVRVG